MYCLRCSRFRDVWCHRIGMRRRFWWTLDQQMKLTRWYFFDDVTTILPTMDISLMHWWCLIGPSNECLFKFRVCFCTLQCRPVALDGFSCWKLDLLKLWHFPRHWNHIKMVWYVGARVDMSWAVMALSTVNSWAMDDIRQLKCRHSPAPLSTSLNFVSSFLMAASMSIQLTLLLKSSVTQFDNNQSVHLQLDEMNMHRITDAIDIC